MKSLEDRLGYTFVDPGLLRLSLTHRSVSSEDPARNDNERLEFLGDSVLQLVITGRLYEEFPQLPEGKMAKVRAALVSRDSLADVARSIDLGAYIELAAAEENTGGRGKDSIVADALEAIIGAAYLDGDLNSVRVVINSLWGDRIAERAKRPGVKDYKTRLQEVLAIDGLRPEYETEGAGPDHAQMFTASVAMNGEKLGEGSGRSKKEAEQGAARQALDRLSQDSR